MDFYFYFPNPFPIFKNDMRKRCKIKKHKWCMRKRKLKWDDAGHRS